MPGATCDFSSAKACSAARSSSGEPQGRENGSFGYLAERLAESVCWGLAGSTRVVEVVVELASSGRGMVVVDGCAGAMVVALVFGFGFGFRCAGCVVRLLGGGEIV